MASGGSCRATVEPSSALLWSILEGWETTGNQVDFLGWLFRSPLMLNAKIISQIRAELFLLQCVFANLGNSIRNDLICAFFLFIYSFHILLGARVVLMKWTDWRAMGTAVLSRGTNIPVFFFCCCNVQDTQTAFPDPLHSSLRKKKKRLSLPWLV